MKYIIIVAALVLIIIGVGCFSAPKFSTVGAPPPKVSVAKEVFKWPLVNAAGDTIERWGDSKGPFAGPEGLSKEAATKVIEDTVNPTTDRDSAKADLIQTTYRITGWLMSICSLCAVGCLLLTIASFFPLIAPWACRTCSLLGMAASIGACLALIAIRYIVTIYGQVTVEIVVWVSAAVAVVAFVAFIVPVVKSWFNRGVFKRGVDLMKEPGIDKTRAGAAIISTVSPAFNKVRKAAIDWVENAQAVVPGPATEDAKKQLKKVGVKL